MKELKQSTAYDFMVFMTDSADHVTGKTGLTLTITASKAGAAFASISPTVTERGNGWYSLALTTSHTDTLGDFALHITASGADPTDCLAQVRANILGDTLPVNVTQFGGNNGTFASGIPAVNTTLIEGSDATNQIRDSIVDDATRIDASALNTLSGHDPGETLAGRTNITSASGVVLAAQTHTGAVIPTVSTLTGHTPQTGDSYAIVSNISYGNAAIAFVVTNVFQRLENVPRNDNSVTWNSTALASIQSECADAIAADKTGYKLASDGLDQIAATVPNDGGTTFPQRLMRLWGRFFGRHTKDATQIKTYRSDGTTVATTQDYTVSGDDEEVEAAV